MGGAHHLSIPPSPIGDGRSSGDDGRRTRAARLTVQAATVSATTLAGHRLVEVGGELGRMLPDGGLRRGSTVHLGGRGGSWSLALALIAATTGRGDWAAAVGLPSLGLVAAAQLGVGLDRLALVPAPGPQWAVVTAALLDSVEVVLVVPPGRVAAGDARRLGARARERGAVLMVVDGPDGRARWPEGVDLRLTTTVRSWEGAGGGAGYLRSRTVEVEVAGRRAASVPRIWRVLLPGLDGRVRCAPPPCPVAVPARADVRAG